MNETAVSNKQNDFYPESQKLFRFHISLFYYKGSAWLFQAVQM